MARMPVELFGSEYNMNHKNRGYALIFNHESFAEYLCLEKRAGTFTDCNELVGVLENLHFNVHVYNDLEYHEIINEIEEFAEKDHSENDCICIVVLSHGELGFIYARNGKYRLDSILSYFTDNRCPSLAGKPRLFFVQACQGTQLDGGITLISDRTETDNVNNGLKYKIPIVYGDVW